MVVRLRGHDRWLSIGSTAVLALLLQGCATGIPKDALTITPDTLERRQLQTRRFEGTDEKKILAASAGVLQDLGFNLDESETQLGVIVASKDRSAVTGGQVLGAILLAALSGTYVPTDKTQKIRVSLIVRPTDLKVPSKDSSSFNVRVTVQRIVWNDQGQVTRTEAIDEAAIYQEFFAKLSKSLFLEANQI